LFGSFQEVDDVQDNINARYLPVGIGTVVFLWLSVIVIAIVLVRNRKKPNNEENVELVRA
jgi:hypothetical protein